jgi:hypothetical protein
MNAMLKAEVAEVRNSLHTEVRNMHLGIAVESNVMAIYDRKVARAFDSEDVAEAYKVSRRNMFTFSGIEGHSFGAQ